MTEPEEHMKEENQEVLPAEPIDTSAKLQAEVSEWKDKYFRALAEMENTRKRLQKDKIESQSFAIQNVIVDFLQPLDHFGQAVKHTQTSSPEIKQWGVGLEMILAQFIQVLGEHGVQPFSSIGQSFDPHQHEAIETEETVDYPPGAIMEEFVRGYKLGGRIIRPAKVKVAVQPVTAEEQGIQEEINTPEAPACGGDK